MSKKVYSLKHATPKMKYQHMQAVMDWKADLKSLQGDAMTEGTRQWMLEEIKRMDPANFHDWYNKVYLLRSANKDAEYEQEIARKYAELETYKHHTNDYTAALEYDLPDPTDARESDEIQNWLDMDTVEEVEF